MSGTQRQLRKYQRELGPMRTGKLKEYCERNAEAARQLAASLIATGVFEDQAWFWAVGGAILGKESD